MFVLNFKRQFAQSVKSGDKRRTIRAHRKDMKRPRPGDHLRLYTGMRTKGCNKLLDATCTKVSAVNIFADINGTSVVVCGKRLNSDEVQSIAHADGFNSSAEFICFFNETHSLPFDGLMIEWEPKT